MSPTSQLLAPSSGSSSSRTKRTGTNDTGFIALPSEDGHNPFAQINDGQIYNGLLLFSARTKARKEAEDALAYLFQQTAPLSEAINQEFLSERTKR